MLCLRVSASCPVSASSLALAWNPSPDSNIAGYNLYWGSASANYTNRVDAGPALTITVSNLVAGPVYYFAVTAYDDLGVESDFSIELAASVPALPVLTLSRSDDLFTLSWPSGATGWTAQASPDLVTWTNLPPAVISSSNFVITEPATESRRFYRLIK